MSELGWLRVAPHGFASQSNGLWKLRKNTQDRDRRLRLPSKRLGSRRRLADDMTERIQIAVVGDFHPSLPSRQAIPIAATLASSSLGVEVMADDFV